jgi:hypothetical protein
VVKASDQHDVMFRWLASYPKSGNTWVRIFVHAYRTGKADINRLGNFGSATSQYAWQSATGWPLDQLPEGIAYLVRPAALANLQRIVAAHGIERPFIKTHSAFVNACDVPQIPLLLTHGAIHLVRDPRDVAVSYAHHFGITYDQAIEDMANPRNGVRPYNMVEAVTDWSTHTDSWPKCYNTKTWRYEDMLDDPRTAFRQILEHLGDEVDEDRLEQALQMTSLDALQAAEGDKGFTEAKQGRFFRAGKSGQYKDELTGKQIARIEKAHGDQMKAWGYL